MNFELTDEQRMIEEMTRDFATNEVKPRAAELDETGEWPEDLVKKMAKLDLLGIMVPEEYGGSGMDTMSYAIATEEISVACSNTSVILAVNNSLVCDPIFNNASEEIKKKYLVPLAKGEMIGCFALTEPGAGSDAAAQKTTAVLDGDTWVINGTKNFITCATHASVCVAFAMTDKEAGTRGISTFVVDTETPGFSVGKVEKKLGLNASGTAEIIFEDCRVPRDNVLAEPGRGFRIAMETLDGGRIGVGAQAVGIARAAFEESRNYAKERVQFGQPIAQFQAIQWMLADMATEIDAARLLVRRAAYLKDKGNVRYSKESAMAKVFASEMAMRTTTKAIQVHGAYGYSKDYPVERFFRDAKVTEIYEGTSEIQRLVIATNLLKE